MKQIFWMSLFGLSAAVLGGCPIYPDNGSQRVCRGSSCYSCPNDYYSDGCSTWQCNYDSECPGDYQCISNQCVSSGRPDSGFTCTQPGDCSAGENCGSDGQCHVGDCSNSGCPSGLQCKLSNGTLQCVGTPTRDGGTTSDSGHDSAVTGCQSDLECVSTGAGAKCLDGTCVKPADQCFDGTQCPANNQCVAGVCTPACDGTHACPTGYSCDTKGVCTGNPTPCGSGNQVCGGGTVCVEQHCVTPCGVGNSCTGAGLVCVNGGCIPDQKPQFICGADGTLGNGMAGNCAVGSLCLHHSCYIGCTPDDAGGTGSCRAADKFNLCKSVTTSSGSFNVCGSSTNLGTDCDLTQGRNCTTGVCIDGYCR